MPGLLTVAYLIAAVLFIMSLGGLAKQETARRGNVFGMLGMLIAVVATLGHPAVTPFVEGVFSLDKVIVGYPIILVSCVIGGAIGVMLAMRVQMTSMPQLVAILHSFVGLAAVLVGYSTWLDVTAHHEGVEAVVHDVEIYLDVAIGAITFTGSIIAWLKLDGKLSGRPLLLPGRHFLNLAMVIAIVGICVPFTMDLMPGGLIWVLIMTAIAGLLGMHLVLAIGGADMPVVVSLLNSYSGWTAAAAGFMLDNDLLIIVGALVGSSGAILSFIMCKAMNRSIWNVVFGGFGTAGGTAPKGEAVLGEFTEIVTDELVELLMDAREVIIVPGYGMAVAQAQREVDSFTRMMAKRGTRVRFGIHPVAGRLPGHMNVLLAEAGVSYDGVLELDEINGDFPRTDVVLVIGANDIVNPGAQTDESSPIYGMPVLEAWKADVTVVLKRGRGVGYAGIANPLFFLDNTRMYFGDAKDSMEKLNSALKARGSKAA
ncbi:MAG: NAD(P) transhydrogenase subunit beta [Kiritimatiellia bacterium]|jgi:NAD(P) transhydrogenase subunit beta